MAEQNNKNIDCSLLVCCHH